MKRRQVFLSGAFSLLVALIFILQPAAESIGAVGHQKWVNDFQDPAYTTAAMGADGTAVESRGGTGPSEACP
jgi:hypothetical protein